MELTPLQQFQFYIQKEKRICSEVDSLRNQIKDIEKKIRDFREELKSDKECLSFDWIKKELNGRCFIVKIDNYQIRCRSFELKDGRLEMWECLIPGTDLFETTTDRSFILSKRHLYLEGYVNELEEYLQGKHEVTREQFAEYINEQLDAIRR